MRAPKRESAASTLRSPCAELRDTPSTVSGVGADGAGTQPKGSVGPVALDGHVAGRAIRATAHAEVRDLGLAVPGGNTLDVDLDAKGLHGLDGQVNVGAALDEARYLHTGGLGE